MGNIKKAIEFFKRISSVKFKSGLETYGKLIIEHIKEHTF